MQVKIWRTHLPSARRTKASRWLAWWTLTCHLTCGATLEGLDKYWSTLLGTPSNSHIKAKSSFELNRLNKLIAMSPFIFRCRILVLASRMNVRPQSLTDFPKPMDPPHAHTVEQGWVLPFPNNSLK